MNEEQIIKLQIFFRNSILRKRIKEVRELNIDTSDFGTEEEFQHYILENESQYLLVFGRMLSILGIKTNTETTKQFIMSYVIKKFPQNVLKQKENKLQKALYSHCVVLHKYIYNDILVPNTQTLKHLINVYFVLFVYWAKRDKYKLLATVYNMYYEKMDKFEFGNDEKISITLFYELQMETLNYIQSISAKDGLRGLSGYIPVYEKVRAENFKKVRNVMEKAFWDILKDDLDSSPPKFDRVVIILEDIKTQLLKLVENSKKEVEQINDILDIEYIDNRITNGTFDSKLLNTLIFFVITKIREYGAPVNDKSVLDWGKNIKNTLETAPDLTYGKLLPPLFEEMMNRIMHIHGAVKIIKEKNIADNCKR